MPRETLPQVLTANHLIEGDVVYMATNGGWVRGLQQAQVFADPDAAQAALVSAQARSLEVVGCYLADVRVTAQGPNQTIEPAHFREDFRRRGPSNYAHGKQAAA